MPAFGEAIDGSTSGSLIDEQASSDNNSANNIAEKCRFFDLNTDFNAKLLRKVPPGEKTEKGKLHHIGNQRCPFGNRERLTLLHCL